MGKAAAESAADGAAFVTAEGDHEAERPHDEAGAERLQVDEPAADEHEDAERDEDERNQVGGNAEGAVQPVDDRGADRAAVPARARAR